MKWDGMVSFVDGHIDGYQLDRLLRGGFFKVRAPVFSHPFVRIQALVVFLLTVFVAGTLITTHNTGFMLIDSNLVGQSAAIFDYFSGLSSFLFGFFVFDQLGNFLTIKGSYLGGFWGGFADVSNLMAVWFPETDEKTAEFKDTIIRYGLASYALMCGSASGELPSEQANVDEAVARQLLTPQEGELVAQMGYNAAVPLLWMLPLFSSNLAGHRGEGFKLGKIEDKIINMRSGVGGVLTAISSFGLTPLPLVHLMSALVKVQLFLLAVKEGANLADIYLNESTGKFIQMSFSTLMVISTPIIFQGLLEFVIMIRNPFGSDWVDLPTRLYHSQMRDGMGKFVKAAELALELDTMKAICE